MSTDGASSGSEGMDTSAGSAFENDDEMPEVSAVVSLDAILTTLTYFRRPMRPVEVAQVLEVEVGKVYRCLQDFPDGWWKVRKYIKNGEWWMEIRRIKYV